MDLTPYVDHVRHEFLAAAEAGGEENLSAAERLIVPLDSTVRLALLNVLSGAAGEITRDLAPGSVTLRLRGLEPDFVVTPPPPEPALQGPIQPGEGPAPADEDLPTARVSFRPSEQLKARIEEAAGREGLSVNAWLVHAAQTLLNADTGGSARRPPDGKQRHTGWAR